MISLSHLFTSQGLLFPSGNEPQVPSVKSFDPAVNLENTLKVSTMSLSPKVTVDDLSDTARLKKILNSKSTLFVGNLPKSMLFSTSQQNILRDLFGKHGSVISIRFPSALSKYQTTKKFKVVDEKLKSISAYVVMDNPESALKCLQENSSLFCGRHIKVDVSDSNPETNSKKSIFIGNLSFDIDEENIWKMFESCGKITGVRMIRDKETGVGKGFGYVSFAQKESTTLALQLNGSKCQGRPIRITKCAKPSLKRKRAQSAKLKSRPNK